MEWISECGIIHIDMLQVTGHIMLVKHEYVNGHVKMDMKDLVIHV